MAAKKLQVTGVATGSTVYAIIRRDSDGFLMDDADGSFAAGPADPYLAVPEHGVILGSFFASEARLAWPDGFYTAFFYLQAGGGPSPVADTLFATQVLPVRGDAEVTLGTLYDEDQGLAADIAAVAASLATVAGEVTTTLGNTTTLLTNLAAVDAALAVVDGNVDALTAALAVVDANVDALLVNLAALQADVDALTAAIAALQADVDTVAAGVASTLVNLAAVAAAVAVVDGIVDTLLVNLAAVQVDVDATNATLTAVSATLATITTYVTSILASVTGSSSLTMGSDADILKICQEIQKKLQLLTTAVEKQARMKV